MKGFLRKRFKAILIVGLSIFLLTGTAIFAANLINKEITGGIEIVTSSGGGDGTIEAPNPIDIVVLNILDFVDVTTTATGNLTGKIMLRNDTGSDLYYQGSTVSVNSSEIGEIVVSSNTTTLYAGEIQTIDVMFLPAGGGMPLGNYSYGIVANYGY